MTAPKTPTPSPTNMPLPPPSPPLPNAIALPLWVGPAPLLVLCVALVLEGIEVGVPLPLVVDELLVGVGKDSVGCAEAMLQNCCESCSAEDSSEEQLVDIQVTIAFGNLPLEGGSRKG